MKHDTPIIEMEKLRPREDSCLASGDSSLVWASELPCRVSGHFVLPKLQLHTLKPRGIRDLLASV